jgi:3-phenylpropionate/cinnamic acid dioxygenase small subunit
MSAKKYKVAFQALVHLAPILDETEWNMYLKPLDRDRNIRALDEAGYDQSEGKRWLSWIWLASGVMLDANGEEGDEYVHDGKFRAYSVTSITNIGF